MTDFPTTVDLDLGRGLAALLTRKDRIFLRWAERVNLVEILAPVVERHDPMSSPPSGGRCRCLTGLRIGSLPKQATILGQISS